MGKPTGFLEDTRQEGPQREPLSRVRDWEEFHGALSERSRRRQGGRCMDCGVPFCQAGIVFDGQRLGCPLHNLIPEWNDLVYRGNPERALSRLLKTNCFPEFTSRVCPALCERACVCGMNGEPVTVRDNERAIIDYAFSNDLMAPQPPQVRSGKRVAVVGSGPAGLAAAYYLNRRGHSVTVFERDKTPGGLLTYGIPNMKLPKEVVRRRVRLMELEGVEFRTGCEVGVDVAPEALAESYDLTVLCCGAQEPRRLEFPEKAAHGVCYALDYLKTAAGALLGEAPLSVTAAGKRVVVVGAGDSAADCIATALRQGCKEVAQLIRKPAAFYGGGDYAHEEATALYGRDIREFETQVTHLRLDADGALAGVVSACGGEEREREAELLILASGFSSSTPSALHAAEALRQCGAEVLTAGDLCGGASLVVLAIAGGKQAAAEADRRLMGYTNIL
ncbi:MAG: glutamate synthase subunit beta [Oscillospiraceae bacterium]|nr:glutamate synthase subunit beta [Oscillospiraceae bacterium]